MTLQGLKDYFEQFPNGTVFGIALSEPFSWRGIYAEVAFSIEERESTKEENLSKIRKALTETFIGWKGGEYSYKPYTEVHFEAGHGEWSDGDYVRNWIEKIGGQSSYPDLETRFINVGFLPTKSSKIG